MPWQPSAAGRRSQAAGTNSLRQIDFDIDTLLKQVRAGIWAGLDETGKLAFAYAKKNAPVRKIFHGERRQGGGKPKGMRTLTDVEVAAEAEDRQRLGLGPGRGVRTLGRPGTHPGRPRAPQNYQIDPQGKFGRVGMPQGEAPYNPHFNMRQQIQPGEKAKALDLANRHDLLEAQSLRGFERQNLNVVSRGRSQMLPPGHPARTLQVAADPDRLITNQREVRQADVRRSRGGQDLRPEELADQPRRRVNSLRGYPLGQRRPHHYIETTGSLRVREARDRLPHGAYGRYEPAVADISDAMTGRGKYEAGISKTSGAQHAGRAVILNPDTGRLQVGGRLKHGITYSPPAVDGTVMTAWVDSPTYYTRYVEFGTRHAHAQPFLRPAVGLVRETMRDRIRRAIASSVRR